MPQSPKGMHDILPEEQPRWEKIRGMLYKIADAFNFLRIDTPIMERAEIFERSGEATDLVEKQMYFVKTKGEDRFVLRPEATASIMRAYFQNGLSKISQPLKLFYIGPMFRYEQPQAGRFRQFHQIGFEIIGDEDDSIYDAQIILASFRLIEELKIKNLIIQINSIGCRQCRHAYIKKLEEYYKNKQDEICKNCRQRLATRPLRLLDCKEEKCQPIKMEAPLIVDKLCNNCKRQFKSTLEYLDSLSLPYSLNPYLVRGLDYYNGVVFEIISEVPELNFALAAGGRYDYLSEMLGEKKVCAVGSAVGIERLIEAMRFYDIPGQLRNEAKVFLAYIGEEAKKKSLFVIEELRKAGIKTIESFIKESLKSQLRVADKKEVKITLIFGQKEVFEESVIIRNMETGNQETVPLIRVVEEVKRRLH
ncbi:histidine--tRNA ligase [Candidatus Wolfebacteria bacterium RIFCSPLOWO2_01_FULL_38_11]|uniref:Histidine--tRNA ligase n=1 Tax=Candidatus Wolfebacteria bacterium RIFCSPLOWO2_01_FULL_38_11 TaxID=1802556 RepID=A0A1F8DUU0_9BACT|nr:MAG: histidine--tRNA ligase [Candidatus Wolfebacteria bacterium RIFCSPLOWO2_01_FULL_38_11]